MMKTAYRRIITVAFAALAALSCTKNGDTFSGEGIILTIRTGAAASAEVKGTTPVEGDDDFNENLLNSVYYFFYPKGVTNAAPSVRGFKTGLSETGSYSVQIPASAETIVQDLFASSNECELFVVANPPSGIVSTLEGSPTLSQLRALAVLSSLKSVPQSNFVMVHDGPVEASSLSGSVAVNASVELKHLAAKFTVSACVAQSVTQGTDVYTPEGVKVYLRNGVNRTTLGGWNKSIVQDSDYFDTAPASMSVPSTDPTVTIDSKDYNRYVLGDPFYSYPMEWEFNSDTEPTLMYEVKWMINGSSTQGKTLYYKMSLGRRSIVQNGWYDISGKIGMLGSETPEDPTEVFYYMDYLVSGWKDALDEDGVHTPAQITDTRYLAVSQNEWTLNNKNEITISFSSSHECEVSGSSIKTTSYSSGVASTKNPYYTDVSYDLSKKNEITVTHRINNTLGDGLDCAPIIIEFDLRHKDQTSFSEHIKIIQNPAITIETFANSTGSSNRGSGASRGTNFGYTYVNAYTGVSGDTNSTDWRQVYGAATSGTNASIYFTLITVSQFESTSDYIVGDPRDSGYDNLDTGSTSDPNTDGIHWKGYAPIKKGDANTGNKTIKVDILYDKDSRNTLKYYHPTIDDGSRDNYVSPSFRVSSAHCRRYGNDSYQGSKQRCASYQEDGYPAGRWRLPTLAECKLMESLSTNGKIPSIFIDDGSGKYHYAGGYFTIDKSNTPAGNYREGDKNTTAAARCVYDEWYWSQVDAKMGWNNSNKTTFYWGDVPDDFVIPTN